MNMMFRWVRLVIAAVLFLLGAIWLFVSLLRPLPIEPDNTKMYLALIPVAAALLGSLVGSTGTMLSSYLTFRRTAISTTIQHWSVELRTSVAEFITLLQEHPTKKMLLEGADGSLNEKTITELEYHRFLQDYLSSVSTLNLNRNKIGLMLDELDVDHKNLLSCVDNAVDKIVRQKSDDVKSTTCEIIHLTQTVLRQAKSSIVSGKSE